MKQGRRKREKAAKEAAEKMPAFDPKYLQAFLVLMLHKLGGTETITMAQLESFPENAEVVWTFDEEKQAVTVTCPDGPGGDGESKILLPSGAEQLAISNNKAVA